MCNTVAYRCIFICFACLSTLCIQALATSANNGSTSDPLAKNGSTSDRSANLADISNRLNLTLQNYDKKLRPGAGGPPVLVAVNMLIRSMGPISEEDMTFSLDAYFRQEWQDPRLAINHTAGSITFHMSILDKIWKPDTFMLNGIGCYLHNVPAPNKLIRISPEGTLFYSMRLTIKAKCHMDFGSFPADKQSCPLSIGSYAYSHKDVMYKWHVEKPVELNQGVHLAQFGVTGVHSRNARIRTRHGDHGGFSILEVNFVLERFLGYYLLQIYFPCTLLVILSWVSFWINREATGDRAGWGVTVILTLTMETIVTRNDFPKVSYPTALDMFVYICFAYVIASLLEFAGVHYFTKFESGEIPHDGDTDSEAEEDAQDLITHQAQFLRSPRNIYDGAFSCRPKLTRSLHDYIIDDSRHRERKSVPWANCLQKFRMCLIGSAAYQTASRKRSQQTTMNTPSMIDRVCRVLFPASFVVFILFYWFYYF